MHFLMLKVRAMMVNALKVHHSALLEKVGRLGAFQG